MIIWGSKGKTKILEKGYFYCPRCRSRRQYHRVGVGKYFSLYFIPLFETKKLGEYIECQTCFTPFETSVLSYNQKMLEEIKNFLAVLEKESEKGMPVNVIYNQLVESGINEELVNNLISIATRGKLLVCENCKLVYSSTLSYCSSCGKRLTSPR